MRFVHINFPLLFVFFGYIGLDYHLCYAFHVPSVNSCRFVNILSGSRNSDMGIFKLPGDSFEDEYEKEGLTTTEFILNDEAESRPFKSGDERKKVLRQMVASFDNLPEQEVEHMFEKLTCENKATMNERSDIMFKLLDLANRAYEVESHLKEDKYNSDELVDAIRSIRSEIRMYAKDLDFYDQFGDKQPVINPLDRAFNDLKFLWQQ